MGTRYAQEFNPEEAKKDTSDCKMFRQRYKKKNSKRKN